MKLLKLIISIVLVISVVLIAVNYIDTTGSNDPLTPTATPTATPILTATPTSTPTVTPTPTVVPTPTPIANDLTITRQPKSTSIYSGDSVSLNCVGSSSIGSDVSYQWYLNTINSIVDSSIIGGATSSAYVCYPPRSYYYYCVVSSVGADPVVSNIIKVTIESPPTPTARPTATPVCATCSGLGTIDCGCYGGSYGTSQGGSGCLRCGGSGNTLDGSFIAGSGRVDCPNC